MINTEQSGCQRSRSGGSEEFNVCILLGCFHHWDNSYPSRDTDKNSQTGYKGLYQAELWKLQNKYTQENGSINSINLGYITMLPSALESNVCPVVLGGETHLSSHSPEFGTPWIIPIIQQLMGAATEPAGLSPAVKSSRQVTILQNTTDLLFLLKPFLEWKPRNSM